MYSKTKTTIGYIIAYFVIYPVILKILIDMNVDVMGANAIGLLGALVIILMCHKLQKTSIFHKENITWRNFITMLGLGFLGNIVRGIIVPLLPEVTVVNQESVEQLIGMSSLATAFLSVVILGPIVEELIFRHLIINILFEKKQWIGLIVSSLLFAALHGSSSLTEYAIYGIPGLVLGYINIRLGIENAIFWHIIMNGLAFLILSVGVG